MGVQRRGEHRCYFENSQPEPRVFHSISVQAKSPARPTQVETQKCPQLIQAQTSALQLSISDSSANPSHQEGCPFHPTLLRRGLALVGSQTSNVHRGTVNHLRGSELSKDSTARFASSHRSSLFRIDSRLSPHPHRDWWTFFLTPRRLATPQRKRDPRARACVRSYKHTSFSNLAVPSPQIEAPQYKLRSELRTKLL
ncbi:hypothetical protein CC1G_13795 [Coprinopsis cinerea okayama7|uniref:Uncharacterized protein n=1 Tax=Coprinopsis cinerea (strain Okayama-7 / 130 / ATCC MYA-4618 / FGSC 9003) TaxID=240176 RepID=D6RKA3_COPC7|nr:hypothetical protein CC1G_13795 [Coprinopsis cinerea okayama7\|eukprot:XP_002912264.1 hypothetical protein CC1G_13795 [Coprinopsis cinerea okayama7\